MNKLTKAKISVVEFVADHEVGIAIVTTAAITLAIGAKMSRLIVEQYDGFIAENGLTEKFNAQFADED